MKNESAARTRDSNGEIDGAERTRRRVLSFLTSPPPLRVNNGRNSRALVMVSPEMRCAGMIRDKSAIRIAAMDG